MRVTIPLLVLFFVCEAQTKNTQVGVQTESQSTGAEPPTHHHQDVASDLKELRDMVVELRVTVKHNQDELKVLDAENNAMKERLVASETNVKALERVLTITQKALHDAKAEMKTEVEKLKKENVAQEAELKALKSTLVDIEAEVKGLKMDSAAHEQELAALNTRVTTIESRIDDVNEENAAQEVEMTAVKIRLADTEAGLENLQSKIEAAPKVAFSAGLGNSGYIVAESIPLNVVFSQVITNVGEAYSSISGFFTAPVKGVYYFRFTVRDNLNSHWMNIRMHKNGKLLVFLAEYETDGQDSYLSSGLTLQLEVGDTVNMVLPAGCRLFDTGTNHSTFSGFLVFPL